MVGSDANDEVVNKRRSSVSFAPLTTIMRSLSDDDQSPTVESEERGRYVRLSFIGTNLSYSSTDRTFTPSVSMDDNSDSCESSLNTSVGMDSEITLKEKIPDSGECFQVF